MERLTKKVNGKYKLITNADLYPGDYVVDDYCVRLDEAIDKLGQYEDIDDDPKHLEKVNKAFKFITKKKVDVNYLYIEIDLDVKDNTQLALTRYNSTVPFKDELTQEEFDLLKEML